MTENTIMTYFTTMFAANPEGVAALPVFQCDFIVAPVALQDPHLRQPAGLHAAARAFGATAGASRYGG